MADEPKRFVIQKHVRRTDVHFDFMIEQGECLQTWRIDTAPDKFTHDAVNAEKIPDHPLRFLTYEGPVNEGKAAVQIADSGTYRILENNESNITLDMDGKILQGKFSLKHTDNKNWQILPVAP
ncbi:MAG: hypothetical protein FVQ79_11390 [Planctomycetes bacterium]|nr:hypothetical protein [Planctomycetota bacterium]